MIHDFTPVRSALRGGKCSGDVPLDYAAAAYRHDGEREAKLLCDQLVVFREDFQGPEAYVSETDDAYIYGFHEGVNLYDRAENRFMTVAARKGGFT
jgi:hypothetical protein